MNEDNPMSPDEIWTVISGLQKAATAFDLAASAAKFDKNVQKKDIYDKKLTEARKKLKKLRALLALLERNQAGGLDWPDESTRDKIVSASQELAEMTRLQLLAEAGLNASIALLDLANSMPKV